MKVTVLSKNTWAQEAGRPQATVTDTIRDDGLVVIVGYINHVVIVELLRPRRI